MSVKRLVWEGWICHAVLKFGRRRNYGKNAYWWRAIHTRLKTCGHQPQWCCVEPVQRAAARACEARKGRDCLRGRGGEREGVWLPSHSADYSWRGLRGAVLQVPGASVSSVPNATCSLLQSRGTLWRAHAHADTSGWESENNKPVLSLPPWFSHSGRHTVALSNSWLRTDFSRSEPASKEKQHVDAQATCRRLPPVTH